MVHWWFVFVRGYEIVDNIYGCPVKRQTLLIKEFNQFRGQQTNILYRPRREGGIFSRQHWDF